jgi:hypothetical protein
VLVFGGSGFKGPGQRQALNLSLVAIEKLENLPAARSSNRKENDGFLITPQTDVRPVSKQIAEALTTLE